MEPILNALAPLWAVCKIPADLPLLPFARQKPLPAGVRCAVCAAFPYRLPEAYDSNRNIARYAVGADYHAVCGARLARACKALRVLFPGEVFEWYCDNAPLPEVALAAHAGLGVRGQHNLLITKAFGTWVFLGEIVTTAALPAKSNASLPKINCRQCPAPCKSSCPTGTLQAGFCREDCVSHISQKKGLLTHEEETALRQAQTAWGCDLCQEACVANRHAQTNPLPEFLQSPTPCLAEETPIEGRAYAWRGRDVLLRNLRILGRVDTKNLYSQAY
ncbi:MAG: DUF1730 domain-containing protein [Oscillospiraceae bacterium]|jgi:epoxyqueuosine reductase QueG|nr:DUF1730 domain-containing protein [Oscillospiraceae bacterium]